MTALKRPFLIFLVNIFARLHIIVSFYRVPDRFVEGDINTFAKLPKKYSVVPVTGEMEIFTSEELLKYNSAKNDKVLPHIPKVHIWLLRMKENPQYPWQPTPPLSHGTQPRYKT